MFESFRKKTIFQSLPLNILEDHKALESDDSYSNAEKVTHNKISFKYTIFFLLIIAQCLVIDLGLRHMRVP